MDIITLPDALDLEFDYEIDAYHYCSQEEITKQYIILNKNTFSFLTEGTKEVIFDDASFSINTSEFLLMKSGPCLMTENLSKQHSNYKSILFFFSNKSVLKFLKKFEIEKTNKQSLQSVYAIEYDTFTKRFSESLLDILKLSKKSQQKILEIKFEELMLYLTEYMGSNFLYSLIEHNNNKTQKFIETVEQNRTKKLTLKELAFLCNMSVSTFKRTFEKQYSESPIKWFQNKRLEYASHLLKEQKRPSDIYLEIGYENLSSFVQAYKAKYGVTPKQHQKS